VAMVLGDSARDRGALCDRIPETLPGVGYVAEEGSSELVRVRAFHVSDDDIARLCKEFRPPDRQSSCQEEDTGQASAA
jgi:DNA segregation ATPase FtsK/SpoIIIE, S-DNA-T family